MNFDYKRVQDALLLSVQGSVWFGWHRNGAAIKHLN
jgi:hypothetical protein